MKKIKVKKDKYRSWEKTFAPIVFIIILIVGMIYYVGFLSYGLNVKDNHLRSVESKLEGLMQQNNSTVLVDKPSFREVISFVQSDNTNNHMYIKDRYDCENFTMDTICNASRAGINAYSVCIRWKGEFVGHNVVGFDTCDMGMVFFEPQDDSFLEVYPGARIDGKVVSDYHVCR